MRAWLRDTECGLKHAHTRTQTHSKQSNSHCKETYCNKASTQFDTKQSYTGTNIQVGSLPLRSRDSCTGVKVDSFVRL
ncbi:hypothetical protein NQZ68_000170 [Dissostichus eleginoides]|nr:hypothetical protein NQZ68_000170 [Dissostichus eleginoides]